MADTDRKRRKLVVPEIFCNTYIPKHTHAHTNAYMLMVGCSKFEGVIIISSENGIHQRIKMIRYFLAIALFYIICRDV
jgi:hypothetical protein